MAVELRYLRSEIYRWLKRIHRSSGSPHSIASRP